MSELQGGLIVLGALVIGAVALFNAWQVRQLRRRARQTLPDAPADALLNVDAVRQDGEVDTADGEDAERHAAVGPGLRREPKLSASDETGSGAVATARDGGGVAAQPGPALAHDGDGEPAANGPSGLWYSLVLRLPAAIDAAVPGELRAALRAAARGVEWDESPARVAQTQAEGSAWLDHLLHVQLVDARGATSAEELRRWLAAAREAAAEYGGELLAGDPAAAAQAARALHDFCSSVDVAIGLNVAASGTGFPGTKLRGLMEASGFRPQADGTWLLSDEDGTALCTLTDGEGTGIDPQVLKANAVRAVSLQVDVPRTPGTLAQFERAVTIARNLAQALQGRVVDDSGRVLDEASIGRIRTQLTAMVKAMRARGIEPGDAIARRVFG